jgi:hypothetical protein
MDGGNFGILEFRIINKQSIQISETTVDDM